MSKESIQRKIANCVQAEKRALDPSFKAYWKNTAETLANKYADKYDISLDDIKQSPEFYNAKASSFH